MRGYPQFSFWILIARAKNCFSRIVIFPRKNGHVLGGTVLNWFLDEKLSQKADHTVCLTRAFV